MPQTPNTSLTLQTKYPEHEKLKVVQSQSQACGDFLAWLETEKHFELAYFHKHGPSCLGWDPKLECINRSKSYCDLSENTLYSANYNLVKLLGEFFEIDVKKIDEEKDQMLAEIRAQNK